MAKASDSFWTVSRYSCIPTGTHLKTSSSQAVFPGAMMGSFCCSVVYNALAIGLVASVPANVKGLAGTYQWCSDNLIAATDSPRVNVAGGLITTAFQIGSALGLAICSIPQHAVSTRHRKEETFSDEENLLKSFAAGLWTSMAMAVTALLLAVWGMEWGIRPNQRKEVVAQNAEVPKEGEEEV